jgi:hypothetical protein
MKAPYTLSHIPFCPHGGDYATSKALQGVQSDLTRSWHGTDPLSNPDRQPLQTVDSTECFAPCLVADRMTELARFSEKAQSFGVRTE